jgi:hypothetical protein
MNENVLAAVIGLNEAVTLLGVEPFYSADSQEKSPISISDGA